MPASMLRVSSQVALLCALAAAAAVIQSCDAVRARPRAKAKPHTSKQPHKAPVHPAKRKVPARKPAPRRKPAVKPDASQERVADAAQLATVEQVTIRRCGTPPVNQTTRMAVQSALQPRMDQLAQSRAARVTVRVYLNIVQACSHRVTPAVRQVTRPALDSVMRGRDHTLLPHCLE